jgi:hypothetical protein
MLGCAGVGFWFATMPYPARMWVESLLEDHYVDTWPISRTDYDAFMLLVNRELALREIVVDVRDVEQDAARVITVTSAGGTFQVTGMNYHVRRVHGAWKIVKSEPYVIIG